MTLEVYDTAVPVTDPMSLYPIRFMPTVPGEWFPCWGKADSFTRPVVAAIRWNGTTLDVGDLVDVPSDTQDGYDHLMRNGRTLTVQGFTGSAFGSTGRVYCYTADPSTGALTMATLNSGTSDVHWGYGHYLTSPYGDVVVLVMNSDAGQVRVRSYRIGADGAATFMWQNDGPIGVFTTIPQFDADNNGGALPVETNKLVFPYNSATLGGAKHTLLVDLESPSPWYPVELPDLFYIDGPTGQPHWLATGEFLGNARFYPGRPNGGKHISGGGGRRSWNSDDGSTSPLVEYHWTGTSLDYVGVVAEEPRYPTPILGSTDFAFPEVSNGSGWVSEHYPLLRYSDDGNSTEWIIYAEDRRWAALINTSDDSANPGILSTRGLRLSTSCEIADGVPLWLDFDDAAGTAQGFILAASELAGVDLLMQGPMLTQTGARPIYTDGPAAAGRVATTTGAPSTPQAVTVSADWVQRYVGDGTRLIDAAGVSQGVLDRDDLGDPNPDGYGHERSLVGFTVDLPADAVVSVVLLRVPWTSWWYVNGVGALVLGWHDHATAPDDWSVGAGAAQLSSHDVQQMNLELPLQWASAAIESGGFRGLVVGPGLNDGALYAGSTTAPTDQWTIEINYLAGDS